jgi:hypothetical protein
MQVTLSYAMFGTDEGVCKMTNGILSKHVGMIAIGSGLIGASIYLLMIHVTLAHIETVSGHTPFDMRPFGYDPKEAVMLLDALGQEGRAYYLSHQLVLDMFYPAMLAATLIATICWFGQRMPNRKLVRIGVALSVASALFDYGENLGIAAMIWSWPHVSVPMINATSAATILKSAATSITVLVTILVGLNWTLHSRSRRLSVGA